MRLRSSIACWARAMTLFAGSRKPNVSTLWGSLSFALTRIWKACDQIHVSQNCCVVRTRLFPETRSRTQAREVGESVKPGVERMRNPREGMGWQTSPRSRAMIFAAFFTSMYLMLVALMHLRPEGQPG